LASDCINVYRIRMGNARGAGRIARNISVPPVQGNVDAQDQEDGMTFRSPKLLKAANGRPCALCGLVGTTVAAHSNSIMHGHGIGHKAPDYYIAYLCQRCHDEIDGRSGGLSKEEKRERWLDAFVRTVAVWFEEGIVK